MKLSGRILMLAASAIAAIGTVHASSRIVFEREGKIYKIKDDGTGLTQLTDPSSPDIDSSPSICPGGRLIVFQRSGDIWKMDQNGDNETNITPNTGGDFDMEPDCGNDGSQAYVTFVSDRDGNNEIYRMTTNGGNVTRLTDNEVDDREPTMCGTGKIAFSRDNGSRYLIWWVDSDDGANASQISPGDGGHEDDRYPACRYDGNQFAYSSKLSGWGGAFWDIVVCDLVSPFACEDISVPGGWDFYHSYAVYPTYSPGGEYIAFSWDNFVTNNYDIWLTRADDGSYLEQLTTDTGTEDLQPDFGELAP